MEKVDLYQISIVVALAISASLAFFNLKQQRLLKEKNNELKQMAKVEELRKLKEGQKSTSGGYIVFDLPEEMRSMFTDLLKGFEEYGRLKGYNITFSVDSSTKNKIAFKFTLINSDVIVNTQTVRNDIKEYIEKVKSGESFDDLPIVISPEEHTLVSSTLKNRLQFLQHSYSLEKTSREHYENLFKRLSTLPHAFNQQPSIFNQTGGLNNPRNLISHHSSHIIQGEENLYENSSDNSAIVIHNSFNKRREQIDKLTEVIRLLKQEKDIGEEEKQKAITSFDKIKDELADEDVPNKSKIHKWLLDAKSAIENIVLSHEASQAIKWVYDSFVAFSQTLS